MASLETDSVIKFQCNNGVLCYHASLFTEKNCPYVYTRLNGKFADCGHHEMFVDEPAEVVDILFKYLKGAFVVRSYYGDMRPIVKVAELFLMVDFIQDVITNGILSIRLKETLATAFGLAAPRCSVHVYDKICNVCCNALPNDGVNIIPYDVGYTCGTYNSNSKYKACAPSESYNDSTVSSTIVWYILNVRDKTSVNNHLWSVLLAHHSSSEDVIAYIQNWVGHDLRSPSTHTRWIITNQN
jgi:hypothetical protein